LFGPNNSWESSVVCYLEWFVVQNISCPWKPDKNTVTKSQLIWFKLILLFIDSSHSLSAVYCCSQIAKCILLFIWSLFFSGHDSWFEVLSVFCIFSLQIISSFFFSSNLFALLRWTLSYVVTWCIAFGHILSISLRLLLCAQALY